ncbi:hypothetical protein NPIL_382041 [Nephila pilipes]|uniref:Uncharacterized protein n=1 Tax=Nephila pilipes TaxID=299642 RepID=A0A8X6MXB0_NEPPI|nr:hypothetical protein NPIL_382041 [Nephila pilipes]
MEQFPRRFVAERRVSGSKFEDFDASPSRGDPSELSGSVCVVLILYNLTAEPTLVQEVVSAVQTGFTNQAPEGESRHTRLCPIFKRHCRSRPRLHKRTYPQTTHLGPYYHTRSHFIKNLSATFPQSEKMSSVAFDEIGVSKNFTPTGTKTPRKDGVSTHAHNTAEAQRHQNSLEQTSPGVGRIPAAQTGFT